jgi:hypothetical protein
MKFILFLMFFVSPPAAPGKQVWAFSNTSHLEFENMPACVAFGTHFQLSLSASQTTTVRAWCVNREDGGSLPDANTARIQELSKNAGGNPKGLVGRLNTDAARNSFKKEVEGLNYFEIPPVAGR